jgi:type IV secretion system protein VirB10
MYLPACVAAAVLMGVQLVSAQFTPLADESFSGVWRLNLEKSEIGRLPTEPDPYLKIEQDAKSLKMYGSKQQDGQYSLAFIYPLDGHSERRQVGNERFNSATKWEGASLLVSTLVSGSQSYTIMEYWKRSRSGATLTITRTIVRYDGESESTLVYENASLPQAGQEPVPGSNADQTPAPLPTVGGPLARPPRPVLRMARPAPDPEAEYVVSAGTHVLLRLTNSVDTRRSAAGDQLYMETAAPIYVNGRLVIPVGSYVTGTVTESHEAGRVKGKSGLNLRIDSLTLPNGVARDFRTRVGSAEGSGKVGPEGQIEGSSNKGRDAGTVAQTTAAGAGLGSVIGAASGHAMRGLGIGSAAGAAAGLASIFATRGPNVVLPRGSTLELVLERDLRYASDEISQRVR